VNNSVAQSLIPFSIALAVKCITYRLIIARHTHRKYIGFNKPFSKSGYCSGMTYLTLSKSKHMLPFAAVLRANGVSVRRLLRMANLPITCLDDPDTLIPGVCEGPFRELAAKAIGCSNISLEATRQSSGNGPRTRKIASLRS
jgi:hypothetical protein